MEERDFAWLCSVLATAGAKLSLQETFFFNKEEVSLWILASRSGTVRKQTQAEDPIRMASEVLQYFDVRRRQECPNSPYVCTASVKGVRIQVTEDRIEEAAALRGAFSRCSFMQKSLDDKPTPLLHVLRIELQGSSYLSSFLLRRTGTRSCSDQRLYYKLIVTVKIILRSLEVVRRRKAAFLELEFFVDREGNARLCGCTACRLIPLNALVPEVSSTTEETLGDSEALPRAKTGFEQEIRPIGGKSAVRIQTPVQFRAEETLKSTDEEEPSQTDSQPADLKPMLRTVSSPKIPTGNSIQNLLVPGQRTTRVASRRLCSFYNANFKEMLAKRYAKSINCFPDDIEQIFLDMDAKLLKDEEPHGNRLKHVNPLFRRSESGIHAALETAESERKKLREVIVEARPEVPETPKEPMAGPFQVQTSIRRGKRRKLKSSHTLCNFQRILVQNEAEKRQSYLSAIYQPILHRKNRSLPSAVFSRRSLPPKPL